MIIKVDEIMMHALRKASLEALDGSGRIGGDRRRLHPPAALAVRTDAHEPQISHRRLHALAVKDEPSRVKLSSAHVPSRSPSGS